MSHYATISDVISHVIVPALGESASDYDVEAIARETYTWTASGFEQVVDVPEFWAVVERCDTTDCA